MSTIYFHIFVFFAFSMASFLNRCDLLDDNTYKVHFKTKGFEDYELVISGTQFIKTLKDGSTRNGTLEWRGDCLLMMIDTLEKKEPVIEKIEAGLGEQCIQFLKRKGNSIDFRTTRTANLNIVINEGQFIKIK